MNGSLTMGKCLFGPSCSTHFSEPRTPPLPPFGSTRGVCGARQRQELRASALPTRAHVGVCGGGTPRTCTTPPTSSAWTRAPRRWGQLLAPREHINLRAWESVRACDEMRSSALITLPLGWSSPGSVLPCPSSSITSASTEKCLITTCWLLLMGSCQPRERFAQLPPDHSWWQATTGVTCGGLPAASCAAPWSP